MLDVTLECLIKGKQRLREITDFHFTETIGDVYSTKARAFHTFLYFLSQNERVHSNVIISGNYITITDIKKHDGGRYQCLAENGMENPPVEAITVIVNCKNSTTLNFVVTDSLLFYI